MAAALILGLVAISWYLDYLNVYQLVGFQLILGGGITYTVSYAFFTEMAILVIVLIASLLIFRFNKYLGMLCVASALLIIYMAFQELLDPTLGNAVFHAVFGG